MSHPFPYHPVRTSMILKPFEEAEKIGSIFLPESAKKPLNQGEVLEIGPDVTDAKVGDIIIFALHMENRIQFDRQTYFVLDEQYILAKADKTEFMAQFNSALPSSESPAKN